MHELFEFLDKHTLGVHFSRTPVKEPMRWYCSVIELKYDESGVPWSVSGFGATQEEAAADCLATIRKKSVFKLVQETTARRVPISLEASHA